MSIEQIHDQVKDSSPRRAVLYARVSSKQRLPALIRRPDVSWIKISLSWHDAL
jgi:predicted site-specific integrase-resolvase